MDHELRAMTLSLAVSLLAGSGASAEDAIEAAKKFQRHVEGTGLTAPAGPFPWPA